MTSTRCPGAILVMSVQSVIGVFITACVTGIMFAKFTKPTHRAKTIIFSRMALVTMRNGAFYLVGVDTVDTAIQLGQLRLNPPGLGSKCSKWVEGFSDFGKYKGNFRNHTTSLPTYRTLSKWGKWVDRLSDFGKYKGYI